MKILEIYGFYSANKLDISFIGSKRKERTFNKKCTGGAYSLLRRSTLSVVGTV